MNELNMQTEWQRRAFRAQVHDVLQAALGIKNAPSLTPLVEASMEDLVEMSGAAVDEPTLRHARAPRGHHAFNSSRLLIAAEHPRDHSPATDTLILHPLPRRRLFPAAQKKVA